MKFIVMMITLLAIKRVIDTAHIGTIRNASLRLTSSSSITINRSTCNECLCDMLTTPGNSSVVSLNCFFKDIILVVCQLFTTTHYQNSSSYGIETDVNSTFYFLQLPSEYQSAITTTDAVTTMRSTADLISSQESTMPTTTIERSLTTITRAGDTIVGLYNTTAGGSTGGKNGMYSTGTEFPAQAIDNLTSTKYLNFGETGGYNIVASAPGKGTGFYVTPAISSASVATGLQFATANDSPTRDPITVTLEGSNTAVLDEGSSWTLIYNGSTGISSTTDPGRMTYVPQQNFSNIIPYKSYRLLITSQRDADWAVQYSEAVILGYV